MDNVLNILTMVGGLAFFLFGMNLLGTGLEKVSGGRLEKTLEKLTQNLFKSLFLGILVTAAIQSSSATTVIVVGLVNAGILKLRNAIGVIMGANIGTTVTSIILSLAGIESSNPFIAMLKPSAWTPIIAIAGIIIMMIAKTTKKKMIGEIMLGFGILFNGMQIMTDAVSVYKDSEIFKTLFTTLSNPFLGILAGAIITAIIQSSSASVGILQAVASTGAITFSAALPIILGQNIGTCITSIISAIGANKNAKRAAMVHLYFNLIGTIIFFVLAYLLQSIFNFAFWSQAVSIGDISVIHIVFNLVTTAIFLPFTGLLEKLAIITVREKKKAGDDEDDEVPEVAPLDKRFFQSPSLAIAQCEEVVATMGEYARKNFNRSVKMFDKYDTSRKARIEDFENAIDRMEDKINNYLVDLTKYDLSDQDSRSVTHLLKMVSEFERIGDYSINIMELSQRLNDRNVRFSDAAMDELNVLSEATDEIIGMAVDSFKTNDMVVSTRIEPLEETIDTMEDTLKFRHIERLKNGLCTIDAGVVFLELLTNLERISDHCSNIAVYVIGRNIDSDTLNRHDYLKEIHAGQADDYNREFNEYTEKYFRRIQISENA